MPIAMTRRRMTAVPVACAALLALPAAAAEVQIGVRATAIDIGHDFVANMAGAAAGSLEGTPPVVSQSTSAAAGIVSSSAVFSADAYTGQMRATYGSTVNIDETPRPGRGGSASGSASMVGSITLTGAAVPGLATFRAVVEGSYNFGNSVFRYYDSAHLDFDGIVGDQDRNGALDFDPFTSAGLFSVPLAWTVAVQPGQRLDMSFYVHGVVTSGVGTTVVDLGNTFKLTAIELPPGYGYVSDAQGFLSQFPSAVPEPGSSALLLAGGALLLLVRRRRASA